jgi:hypothetical protein
MVGGVSSLSWIKLVEHALSLHNPRVRLGSVTKVRDQASLAAYRDHLNCEEMPILGDNLESRLCHDAQHTTLRARIAQGVPRNEFQAVQTDPLPGLHTIQDGMGSL